MKKIVLAGLLVAFHFGAVSASQANDVQFERVGSIAVSDLWSLTSQAPIVSRKGAVLAYWTFDPENAPRRGAWTAIGIVLAGLGDVGEKPVGIRVWTKAKFHWLDAMSRSASAEGDTAIGAFGILDGGCSGKAPVECVKMLPHIMIDSDGRVTDGARLLGIVK